MRLASACSMARSMSSETGTPSWRLVLQACLMLLAVGMARFFVKLYRIRCKFQQMQKEGLPMPPHHPVFGHLQLVAGTMSRLPKDVHGHVLPHQIGLLMPELGPVFYIDTWPFGPPILAVAAPDPAYQITQLHSLPKFHALREYMSPMTGGNDLTTMEGKEWKTWRNIFNPGFSSGHLNTLVPEIMEDISVFCEILRDLAKKPVIVLMDPLTSNLSLDIICRVALNTRVNAQRSTNSFVSSLRNQIRWLSFGNEANLFERYHPLRPIMRWWNGRQMVRYVSRELDLRFNSNRKRNGLAKNNRSKTIIDLALDNYLAQQTHNGSSDAMDATFRDFATSQLRTFVFAGHDSTGSTICYAFHLLSTHSSVRRLLIAEHNRVLGPEIDQAASRICENTHILGQLRYTLAVVKETLRMYPPASSTRSGEPGYSIQGLDGLQLPTDGFLVWSNSYAIHHADKYWPEPDKFIPERWLVEEGDDLYPPKGAYRPFEFGPRNCIGQELAMLEIRLVLAMTAREFEIKSVYNEWDSLHPTNGPKMVNGDRAYQILSGAAHPSDGLPCRILLAVD